MSQLLAILVTVPSIILCFCHRCWHDATFSRPGVPLLGGKSRMRAGARIGRQPEIDAKRAHASGYCLHWLTQFCTTRNSVSIESGSRCTIRNLAPITSNAG